MRCAAVNDVHLPRLCDASLCNNLHEVLLYQMHSGSRSLLGARRQVKALTGL
jgi:hypothetical protein